jgi:hypothetical protein
MVSVAGSTDTVKAGMLALSASARQVEVLAALHLRMLAMEMMSEPNAFAR